MPAIIKPSRLAAAVRAEPVPQGGLLTVSAFLLSDFESPRDFLSEQALWPMVVEQMGGAIFDKGNLKPSGEWIVAGAALAPGDEPVSGIEVIARLNGIEKRLSVFGDRFWRQTDRGIVLLPAIPFHKMPVVESNAFGGPRFAANPRGKGHGARALLDAGLDAPLPNVEDAKRPIRSPDDTPAPAHFGPLAPDAASRMRYIGTYDQVWLKTLAPLRPADFNPLFHCDAPEEQRLTGYFSGSETFSVSGMSQGGIAGGRLPDVTVRGFAHRPGDDSLTEFRMVCDTVTLFPNITKMVLAYRGVVKCADAFAEDIGTVMLAVEHAEDEAYPPAYFGDVFRLRTNPDEAHKHALSDFQLMPKQDASVVTARRAARLEKAKENRERFMDNQDWLARRLVADQGMSADLIPPRTDEVFDDLPLVALPTSEEIARGELDLAEILDDVEKLSTAMKEKARKERARAEVARLQAVAHMPQGRVPAALQRPLVEDGELARYPELSTEMGLDTDWPELTAFENPDLTEFPQEAVDRFHAALDNAFNSLTAPEDDQAAADVQFEKALARALRLPEGAMLADARSAAEQISLDLGSNRIEGKDEIERRIAERMASVANEPVKASSPVSVPSFLVPGDEDFEVDHGPIEEAMAAVTPVFGKLLSHLDSVKAGGSLQDIIAEAAAALPQPEDDGIARTFGQHVDEVKRKAGERIDTAQQDLDDTMLRARQRSPVAIFPMEPLLPGVAERFGNAIRDRIVSGHDFRGADLAGADLRGIDLAGRDLRGTLFERCNLQGAQFSGSNLDGAVFSEADLSGADFSSASLGTANFGAAVLSGARFDACTLEDTKLIRVNFEGVSWRDGHLARLSLIECSFDGADLSGSTLSEVQVLKGGARRVKMDGVALDRVTFIQIPLTAASFVKARLDRVSLAEVDANEANFKSAEFNTVGFLGQTGLRDSSFEGVSARSTSWNTADMTRTCLLRADLDNCLFNVCDLSLADMRLATLKNCRLDKSALIGADLFAANLFAASLTQCDMTRASLRGANLYYAALDRAELASCDLTGANLGGTRMERAANA
ncbi:uncharacterized protein YjbI with pentapeptide repeats [Pseudorhizobium tarimense]|uniref:Uncharacterized protein YjbI with pentapeptide repeats n=1 Tax=Pseudorhizobium tarimense TaxID=1079109 RepID=A0ABV2H4H5_9HYPH|nr:DUF2169 domain-containing protein [Pseudorhizobium tarimense]MCJ8518571.1 pentapeptide repeat-containing protein [Pseudorhizobium tarimense]